MICLPKDPELHTSMGQNGRQLVNKNYSLKVVGKSLDSIYQENAFLFFKMTILLM